MAASPSSPAAGPPDPFLLAADLLDPPGGSDVEEARRIAASMRAFTPAAWRQVEPSPFKSNWHIDCICEHLEAVHRRQIMRLVINIPPRHMKSLGVCVLWPAWTWLQDPTVRFLFASYAQALSQRDSLKTRRLVESRGGMDHGSLIDRVGYQGLLRLLGHDWTLAPDQSAKLRFENTAGGYRLATSVGGVATGEGGDILVVDDPHKADEVDTETGVQRQNALDWMDGTLSSRLNDPRTGRVVVVMQRLHENDVTGHLLEQGGYHHLCLPAQYDPSHPFVCPRDIHVPERVELVPVRDENGEIVRNPDGTDVVEEDVIPAVTLPGDPRTEDGEVLWPGHFDEPQLAELRKRMGAYRAAGQLQQLPAPPEGGIFKTAWWNYYPPTWLGFDPDEHPDDEWRGWPGPHFTRMWQSWDTALKEKTSSDFNVGQLWAQHGPDRYLLRQVRGQWSLPDLIQHALDLHAWTARRFPRFASHSVFVENTANGPELIAALRRKLQGVVPVTADRDKVSRAHAITPQIESGNVYLPGQAVTSRGVVKPDPVVTPAWAQDLVNECAHFPNAAHDDQVDALTQALDPRRWTSGARGRAGERDDKQTRRFASRVSRDNV